MPVVDPQPFWKSSYGSSARFYCGDCLTVAGGLQPECAELVFADPPFNVNYGYDLYEDNLPFIEYIAWTKNWLRACHRLLKPTGSIWVAIGVHFQAEMKRLLDEAGFYWRDTICWHYTFGPRQEGKFTPSWVALHYYTKHPKQWTWNPEAVRVPSARQLKYNDRRAVSSGKLPDNVWALLPKEEEALFQPGMNAWLESRVCGTFKARTGHPCQMPTAVLNRIINACSNPGDVVLDPFLGSGTTAEVALSLGRKALGIELSQDYLVNCVLPRVQQYTTGAYGRGWPKPVATAGAGPAKP